MHPISDPIIQFSPPWHLRNAHIQAVLSSSRLRKRALAKRNAAFLNNAIWQELNAGNSVTLAGEFNSCGDRATQNTLIVLLHGWEGSSKSNYVVSAGAYLNNQGFDVFRLNFRDHGDTYALNKGIFNSSLIDEVVGAIACLQEKTRYANYGVMGFSLGGNFALRTGLHAHKLPKPLAGILAVSPVIDPEHTMEVLNRGAFWYEKYFARKWSRSLRRKSQIFPEYKYQDALKKLKSLNAMNHYFIPRYTDFESVASYFKSYTLSGDVLSNLNCPTRILTAKDDPVIPIADFDTIARPAQLTLHVTRYGSHCAYLRSLDQPSWADQFASNFFGSVNKTDSIAPKN